MRAKSVGLRLSELLFELCEILEENDTPSSIEFLHMAISTARLVAEITPDSDSDKPVYLNKLGLALGGRHGRLGDFADLDGAVEALQRAVDLASDKHPTKPDLLTNLGNCLTGRFNIRQKLSDVESAIAVQQQAVRLTFDGHRNKPIYLSNLAVSLFRRFQQLDTLMNIVDSTVAHANAKNRASLSSTKAPSPSYLNPRSEAFQLRFLDIDDAILSQRRAIDLTPRDHPIKPAYLHSLGNYLRSRSGFFLTVQTIHEAVLAHQQAVDLTPLGHPSRPTYLSSLGHSLHRRSTRQNDRVDMRDAIAAMQQAIDLLPDGHPDTQMCLKDLGYFFRLSFEYFGNLPDIEKAIASGQMAVQLVADTHPSRFSCLVSLATSFQSRFEHLEEPADFERAVDLYMQAAVHEWSIPAQRLDAVMRCARLCWESPTLTANGRLLEIYKLALPLVSHEASHGYDLARRYHNLANHGNIASSAAAAAIASGQHQLAIEWLEEARGIVWSQLLQLRAPMDDLRERHPELAAHLQNAAQELEQMGPDSIFLEGVQIASVEDTVARRRELAVEHAIALNEIRKQQGFERFLLPKQFTELAPAPQAGFVAIVNVHHSRCDALIICPSNRVVHTSLPDLSYQLADTMRIKLVQTLQASGVRDRGAVREASQDDATVPWILERLWKTVVLPILQAIEQEVSYIRAHYYKAVILTPYCNQLSGSLSPNGGKLPHITWCPTGALAFLPLHAAGIYDGPWGEEESTSKAFKHFVSSYTPTLYAVSCSAAPKPPALPLTSTRILIISQPQTPNLSPLPGTGDEVSRIKNRFPDHQLLHLDHTAATVGAVIGAMNARAPQILHLACHGVQDNRQPIDSAFMLYDGPLSLSSLATNLASSAAGASDLAFLSACHTAAGDGDLTDEAVHLAAAMLTVGYKAVVGTMWSIGDIDAPLVADEFYARLNAGGLERGVGGRASVAYALHEATNRLRSEIGEHEFLRWIPYVHFGL
jgi:tetratricopeptide (TPR) repeat protein